ncbi:MAG: hypothetical protein HBSAPP03_18550 [Phycisphaerae bacterium]|nr:MAG: hypothetical protein HBSAPP03_18550 [Phycisphaerae bacterium]
MEKQRKSNRADACGYVRVSTVEQAQEGLSLDAQRAKIGAYCMARDIPLGEVYADRGISGRRTCNRPGLEAAIDHACRTKGPLVVYSLSRLARSTRDAILIAERLDRCGAQLVLISENVDTRTAAGRMFYAVLAALAQFEADQIAERTSLALRYKRQQGKRWCRDCPYGFKWRAGRMHEDVQEQRTLGIMHSLRRRGLPFREMAKRLEARGVKNRDGRPFPFQRIAVLLGGESADGRRTA